MAARVDKRLRKNMKSFSIPPCERLVRCWIGHKGNRIMLVEVEIEYIHKKRKEYSELVGLPLYFALARGSHEVHVYPAPYVSINVSIEYDLPERKNGTDKAR
jgi:hypothetical protein